MAKRFTKRHTASGYSAMGGKIGAPRLMTPKHRTVSASIEASRAAASRAAKIQKKKK